MNRLKQVLGVWLLGAVCLVAPAAHADSAEKTECDDLGETCSTPEVSDGVCKVGQCWACNKDKVITYSCNRCETAEQAAAGAPAAPAGDAPKCVNEDDGGCTVQRLGTEQGIGGVFLAVGLAAFLVARRRR